MPKPSKRKPSKRGRRQPPANPMPPRIDASPDDIAWAILNTPPKKNWRYLRESEGEYDSSQEDEFGDNALDQPTYG